VPDDDYLAFIEPYEGMVHLEALRARLAPRHIVEVKPAEPLRSRVAGFPEDLPFSSEEVAAFQDLHQLLSDILRGKAHLRAQQVQLHKSRHAILSRLWVFGCYGAWDPQGLRLVGDSDQTEGAVEFARFVRKRDNTLHDPAVIGMLRELGVVLAHTPLGRKAWRLEMSFGEVAGGPAALQALQRYATRLVEVYGRPAYAGSSRYRGEAYRCFSRADMGVLRPSQS
jgi:hypothetical protein